MLGKGNMSKLTDQKELIRLANKIVKGRVDSLDECVARCLERPPFTKYPALLYSFATIDRLIGDPKS